MKMQALFMATACFVSSVAAQAAAPAGAPPATTAAPAVPVPLEIVVFDKPDYKGTSLRIARAIADLGTLKFDNKVASLQILGAGDWVLCENRNYQGRCARVQLQAGNLKLFQLNDRVSSLYPVPAPVAAPAPTPATTPAPASTPKPAKTN
jgi:hypothetical protein